METTTATYLAQYGISPDSLSPTVKDGINEVLRAGATQALQQLGKILQTEANKAGIGTTPDTAKAKQQAEAAQKALDAYNAEVAAKAKRKKQLYLLLGVLGAICLAAIGLVIYKRRQHK